MRNSIGRRELLTGGGAALLIGALGACGVGAGRRAPMLDLPRLRASADRITNITVCTQPFRRHRGRASTSRKSARRLSSTITATAAAAGRFVGIERDRDRARARDRAARRRGIGCGALGITSALLLQRAGARVLIYAKELPPNVRSSLATGVWSPDSRICLEEEATPAFRALWEGMARQSFRTYQTLLGLPGDPVEFIDNYVVTDVPGGARRGEEGSDGRPKFAMLHHDLASDLATAPEDFAPGMHRFGARSLRRRSLLMFNIAAYSRMLVTDFLVAGGQIEIAEFHSPAEFAGLRQRTVVNATGYGARALFGDQTVTPVRGQLARTIPQPDVRYGLMYRDVAFVPRRDGFVFQVLGDSDYHGFGDESTTPDRAEAERAVNTIAGLFPPA